MGLESEAIVVATVTTADRGGGPTAAAAMIPAQANLPQLGSDMAVEELVAEKGYHDHRIPAQ